MPIPSTRSELLERIERTYAKLGETLAEIDARTCELACTEAWSIRELICVRLRWTEMVNEWIEAGRRGEELCLPAPGFKWSETPHLATAIIAEQAGQSWEHTCARLAAAYERTLETITSLSDQQLLEPGAFVWAGAWPVSRWLSINTATQYESARKLIRKAHKDGGGRT